MGAFVSLRGKSLARRHTSSNSGKSVSEIHPQTFVTMMMNSFNKHYCAMKLHNKLIQRWSLNKGRTLIHSASYWRRNEYNVSWAQTFWALWSEVISRRRKQSKGTWSESINKIKIKLLSMIFNIDRLCCKSFRRISDRLLINRSMVNHWQ